MWSFLLLLLLQHILYLIKSNNFTTKMKRIPHIPPNEWFVPACQRVTRSTGWLWLMWVASNYLLKFILIHRHRSYIINLNQFTGFSNISCKRSFGFFPLFGRTSKYSFSISGHVLKMTKNKLNTFHQSQPSGQWADRKNLPQKFLDDHFAKKTGAASDENGSIGVHFAHSVLINVIQRVIIVRCHCELWAWTGQPWKSFLFLLKYYRKLKKRKNS